jgi:uncharacterized RDD family membrane protein YckC
MRQFPPFVTDAFFGGQSLAMKFSGGRLLAAQAAGMHALLAAFLGFVIVGFVVGVAGAEPLHRVPLWKLYPTFLFSAG